VTIHSAITGVAGTAGIIPVRARVLYFHEVGQ